MCVCVDTIILSFFNSFWSSATKISSSPLANDTVCQLTLCTWLYPYVSEKTSRLWKFQQGLELQAPMGACSGLYGILLSYFKTYCQCTLPYGDYKVVMRVGCLPNCGELFANFWPRLVDMKVVGGHLPGGDLNVRAGSPCKGPPPIFGGLELQALARDFMVYCYHTLRPCIFFLASPPTSLLSPFLNNNPKKQQKPVTKNFLNENKHM